MSAKEKWRAQRDGGPAVLPAVPLGLSPMRSVAANRQRPTTLRVAVDLPTTSGVPDVSPASPGEMKKGHLCR